MEPFRREQPTPQLPPIRSLFLPPSAPPESSSPNVAPAFSHPEASTWAKRWIEDGLLHRSEDVENYIHQILLRYPAFISSYLSQFHSSKDLNEQIHKEIDRLINNTTTSLKNTAQEWKNAIIHVPDVDNAWKDDPEAFWGASAMEIVRQEGPQGFLRWGFFTEKELRNRRGYKRTFILYICGKMIRDWAVDGVLKRKVDEEVATVIKIEKDMAKRFRLVAVKYYTFIEELGLGAGFLRKVSDKAEQIGTVDLDYVISDCRREGLYEKNLKQYETIALNIIQAVKLK